LGTGDVREGQEEAALDVTGRRGPGVLPGSMSGGGESLQQGLESPS